jgi:hypothetical protein
MRALVLVLGCTFAAALGGCGRRVVVDPGDVARENDRTWTVTSEPGAVVAPVPTQPPAVAAPGARAR